MQLSNNHEFDLFAVFPHCLDNEYWPKNELEIVVNKSVSQDDAIQMRKKRNQAVHREFIRSLIYSPQVFCGRQSAVSETAIRVPLQKDPESIAKLMSTGRFALLLMEDTFESFINDPPFSINPIGQKLWRDFFQNYGSTSVCSLRLTSEKEKEVRRRYYSFFSGLVDDLDELRVLFAECSGREISDLLNPKTAQEYNDFERLVKEDLVPWVRSNFSYKEFKRSEVYKHFVNLSSQDADTDLLLRRARHRLTMRRIADLAYNHNTPVALGRQSFTTPHSPDPTSLPSHLYTAPSFADVEGELRRNGGQTALSELIEERTRAGKHFFYRMQKEMTLPDVGSFTVRDVLDIHSWDEWKYFAVTQDLAFRFIDAQDLRDKLEKLFDATVKLHRRFEHEMKQRAWWRRVAKGSITLGVAITAYVGCETILPPGVKEELTYAAGAIAGGLTHKTLEAGLDLSIHGFSTRGNRLLTKIGGRQTVSRQLRLSSSDLEHLDRLNRAKQKTLPSVLQQDHVLRQSEGQAKEA